MAEPAHSRRDLVGLTRPALAEALAPFDPKPFRVRQVWSWLYNRGATGPAVMTDLAKDLRARLEAAFYISRPETVTEQQSADGTRKWLFRFADGHEAETVLIPEEDRGTLCVSSQVGCTLTCRFCHTGTQRLVRNLTAAEIVGQVLAARDAVGEWPTPRDENRRISNIVFMGMGEPLFNYEAVRDAIQILTDGAGVALSRRRITVSTSGVVPMIAPLGAEVGCNLAISLHAVTDEVRNDLMPINRKYPLAELMAALRAYPGLSNARRITFEYLLLKDINDSPADARALVALVKGIPCKFNLLPFNAWPGSVYAPSPPAVQERFADILARAGFTAPIRTPRGQDILAACGQLRSESQRLPLTRHRARLAAGLADDHAADPAPAPSLEQTP